MQHTGLQLTYRTQQQPVLPPDHIKFIQELVAAGVVVITLGHHQIEGSAVLRTDLLHQVIRHFLGLGKERKKVKTDKSRERERAHL